MFAIQRYTKPSNQRGYNQHPNQYKGYKQAPHPQQNDQGLAGIMQAPLSPAQYINIFEYMNQPQQDVQYDHVPVPLSSVGTTPGQHGQGPAPYSLSLMGQYSARLPHGHLKIIDHQGSPQRGYLQMIDGEKSPIFKRDKKGIHKTEENEIQDHLRKTKQFEEDDYIDTKLPLSRHLPEYYRHKPWVGDEGDDDVSNEIGGRRRQGLGYSWRWGKHSEGKNKQQNDKQNFESFQNYEDEDEIDRYASRYFRSISLFEEYGSIDIMGSHGYILKKRGRGGIFGGRGGQTRNINEDGIPSTDDSYQSYCGHIGFRGRVRGKRKERRGYGVIENRNEMKREKENAQEKRNGRKRGRVRGGKEHIDRQNKQDERNVLYVDELNVFKFLIKSFGGGCTFEDFLRRCDLFPNESDIRLWFKKHVKRIHVFWKGKDIVYLQPFYKDAKICAHWNNMKIPAECQNAQCEYFHICRRFIRDNCIDKDCPLSHSFRSPHNRHLKDKLGISYLSDADIMIVLNCNFPSVCADYIYNDVCKVENAGKICPHLHLCQMKIFGKCEDPCKFNKTRSINKYHNKWVLASCHMKGWPPSQVFKAIYVPPRQKAVSEDYFDVSDLSRSNVVKDDHDSSESEDEMDNYWGSRDDQRLKRGSRGNLNKIFGSIDSIGSHGFRQNRRGRGGYNRDGDVNVSSESLKSTASGPARKFNKLFDSVENLSIDDVRERRTAKLGRRERFKSTEDIICGIVGKYDYGLPKMSVAQQKDDDEEDNDDDDDDNNEDDDDIKEKEVILKGKYRQEKQPTSYVKVVKPKPQPRPSKMSPSDLDYQERNPALVKDETENSKICMFLSNDKCSSASCKNLHLVSGIPYLWQIKMFGKWVSLTLVENEKIEKVYCDLRDVESFEVLYMGNAYSFHIWFSMMKAIIYNFNGIRDVEDNHWCNVRRLSTPSFFERKMTVDSYLTQWRWYWKDDSEKWIMFNKDVQFTLEWKYQTKQKINLYTRENNYMHMIDFEKMIRINLDTETIQMIIRRPLFVSKDDVQQTKCPDSIPFPTSTAKPTHYYHWDSAQDFELVELDTTEKEFIDVLKSLQDSMNPAQFGIESIYSIQNRKLWSEYSIKKKVMLADAKEDGHGRNIDERNLFHGTESWKTCRDICTNNFDFSTSGSFATLYGQGSYFAVHSKMMSYSTRSTYLPTNIRFMFRAKVLVGQFTKGHPSFRRPPKIPEHEHKLYDSCVDQVHDPKLFVVFDRNQCYPDYLIMYTDKNSTSVDKTGSSSNLQMHTDQLTTHPINYGNILHTGYQMVALRRPQGQPASLTRQGYQDLSAAHSEESPDYPHSKRSESFSNKPNANNLGPPAKSYNKIKSSNLQMKTVLNVYGMGSCQGPLIYQRLKEYPTLTTKQSYLKLCTTHSDETPAVMGAHLDKQSSLLTSPILCDGMYIDCIPDKRLDTRPAFFSDVKDEGSLLTSPILCDGMYIDCIPDKRLDTRPAFFSNVKDEDTYCLLSELEKTQPDEFACLVYTSHHLKTRKSLESTVLNQLFRYSILNGSSLMCRLILSFITYNVKGEPYLIQMMFLALDKVEKDCARAISWFITRTFYLQYQSLLKELIDIWPSFCCPCSKRFKSSACSTEVVIVVELENACPQLPKQFCQLQIISIKKDDILNSEASAVYNEFVTSNRSLHLPENEGVSSVMAKELFTKHSKLTLICKSFRKSKGYKNGKLVYILNVPCVQLYCSAKGCIPIGEEHFPKDVCGFPTDILQGTPSLMANLKVGDKIGTDNYKMGTLGGFVKVRGDVCFLTCLHVFLSADDLASDNISLDDDAGVIVKCYSTGSVTCQGQMIPYDCGRIREIAFEMDNERETSIDAALITLSDRSKIDENDYLANDIDKALTIRDIGMKSKYLNENCIDFKPLCYSVPCPKVEVVAVGAISGICNAEAQVKENNEKSIDLESIEQTFSNVILTELKEKVGQVIEQLKGQVHNITCDQICAIIGQVCDPSISDEFKSVILDIIQNILPRIIKRRSQNCNTNTNNNHEDAIFCSTCAGLNQPMCMCFHGIIDEMVISKTTSHLSSIFSDVHMQQTFLRRTGDQQSLKRTSRRVYNQIHVSNIPFKPGDSGTCIYTVHPSAGCIGMAIANHPQSGCIATPIKEILKHFKIKIK